MISQHQANEASRICARALEQIAAIARDIAEMKKAADEFNTRMAEQNSRHG
jgi:hypothetical protein